VLKLGLINGSLSDIVFLMVLSCMMKSIDYQKLLAGKLTVHKLYTSSLYLIDMTI